jgi:hypothetical protein
VQTAISRIDSAQFGPASFVVCALGDLDAQSDELRARLMPLAAIEDARLVLDLGGGYALGDRAIGVIAEVAGALGARGGRRLVIVATDPWTKNALATAGIGNHAQIETTLTRGLAHASD